MTEVPKTLRLQEHGAQLRVEFSSSAYEFSAEFLRVFSPSAEVQGHGLSEPQLVGGKREVIIRKIEPVGRYAVRLTFSDGHDSGLYSWEGLARLGQQQSELWQRYLQRMDEKGMSRDEADNVMPLSALRPRNALKP